MRPGSSPLVNVTVALIFAVLRSTTVIRSRSGSEATAVCPSRNTRRVPPLMAGGGTTGVTVAPSCGWKVDCPRTPPKVAPPVLPKGEEVLGQPKLLPSKPPVPEKNPPVPVSGTLAEVWVQPTSPIPATAAATSMDPRTHFFFIITGPPVVRLTTVAQQLPCHVGQLVLRPFAASVVTVFRRS